MPHVVFIHLDLGIGGAESLILNLAKATLPNNNSSDPFASISIYTTHCSPTHCYPEVHPTGSLAKYVQIRGSFLPRSFSLGGTALCSAIRMMHLTFAAARENPNADVFVLDVLPTGIPYLTEVWGVKAGVLFYCHFPDKLLTRDTVNGESDGSDVSRTTMFARLKGLYRWAMDATEEWTMGFSDLIVVNSKFTMGEVKKVFPSLFLSNNEHVDDYERVKVLYPTIESSISKGRRDNTTNGNSTNGSQNGSTEKSRNGPIVSLNRFERKKNIPLLLHAYGLLLERVELGNLQMKLPPLIIAGGYDPLNTENVEHLAELRVMADQILARFNLPPSIVISSSKSESDSTEATITFYPSISNEKRTRLLAKAQVWCYTPHREHFGIVPLEAMDAGVPIVAIRSGGPMETIVDGVTGYLVDYSPIDGDVARNLTVRGFAHAIASILVDPQKASEMGQRGKERVHELFGMETFRKQWWEMLYEAKKRGEERYFRNAFSYPRLVYSIIRCLFELLVVCLIAYLITWLLKMAGWIEEDRGILGTVKYHYFKMIEEEEL
jgi:glycosyltransferase involved in cell wall biosynthesis